MAQALSAQKYFLISCSSSGANQIIAGTSGYKIRVLQYVITASGSVNAKWQNGSTDVTGLLYMTADTGASVPYCKEGLFETTDGNALNLNLSGATAVGGHMVVSIVPSSGI